MAESLNLKESARELRLATAQLRDFNQSAGVEIAKTVGNDLKKGVLDPFTQSFAQIPGVATLGSVGKTLFNKTFSAMKERRERELLRQQLGISKEQFKQLEMQKKVADAQKKFGDNINSASQNLLGFDAQKIRAAVKLGAKEGSIVPTVDKLIEGQKEQIDKQEEIFSRGEKFKSREEAEQNRKERKEEERTSIFTQIAEGIKGLAKGANDAVKKTTFGKIFDTLFAPIGAVGAIISGFVGAFITQVKADFAPLFKRIGLFFRGLTLRLSSAILPPFKLLFGEKGLAGGFFKFLGNTIDKVKGAFQTTKDALSKNLFIRTIGTFAERFGNLLGRAGKGIFGLVSSVIGRIRDAAKTAANLPIIKQVVAFAKGFGGLLGRLLAPVTLLISAFDGAKEAVATWNEGEGKNIASRVIDAIGEGAGAALGTFFGFLPDLLKNGVSYLIKKVFGVETDEQGNVKEGQGIPGKVVEFLDSFSFIGLIQKIVSAPFNLISKIVDRIMGYFDPDSDTSLIGDLTFLKDKFKTMISTFFKKLIRAVLPPPDFLSFKLPEVDFGRLGSFGGQQVNLNPIPDGVYRFAGLNPETGEVEVQKSTQDVIDLGRAGLQDEFFKAQREKDVETMERLIREAREERENNTVINQIYNQQDQRQSSSNNTIMSEGITDVGGPPGAVTAFGPS